MTERERIARELERAEWYAVAEDVREGIPLDVIASRLHRIEVESGEPVDEALTIIA